MSPQGTSSRGTDESYREANRIRVSVNTASSSSRGSVTATVTIRLFEVAPSRPLATAADRRPYASWKERAMP